MSETGTSYEEYKAYVGEGGSAEKANSNEEMSDQEKFNVDLMEGLQEKYPHAFVEVQYDSYDESKKAIFTNTRKIAKKPKSYTKYKPTRFGPARPVKKEVDPVAYNEGCEVLLTRDGQFFIEKNWDMTGFDVARICGAIATLEGSSHRDVTQENLSGNEKRLMRNVREINLNNESDKKSLSMIVREAEERNKVPDVEQVVGDT
jgi:hypothetical protein